MGFWGAGSFVRGKLIPIAIILFIATCKKNVVLGIGSFGGGTCTYTELHAIML
jgi:hypothetical protein